MPIEGFPDPKRHRVCARCLKWWHAEEMTPIDDQLDVVGSLFTFPSAVGRLFSGTGGVARLLCPDCVQVRKRRPVLWLAWLLVIGGLIAISLLLYGIEGIRFW